MLVVRIPIIVSDADRWAGLDEYDQAGEFKRYCEWWNGCAGHATVEVVYDPS